MDTNQENFLTICVTTQETTNSNNSSWSGLPAFGNKYSVFNSKVSELNSLKEIQEKNLTGFAKDKSNKKNLMIDKTIKIIAGVKAYALDKNNPVIFNEVGYTRSELSSARDEEVAGKCQVVHDRANMVISELPDYGITTADLTELQSLIGNYSASSQLPAAKVDERQAVTSRMGDVINEIKEVLGVMDNLVLTLKDTQPDFAEKFKNSRTVAELKGSRPTNEKKNSGNNKSPENK
jgi:hypothetical protein